MENNRKNIRPAVKGFCFMIMACIVYLVWWFVNYFPDSPYSSFIGNPVGMAIWGGMFAAVFVLCVAGGILISRSFRRLVTDRAIVNMRTAVITCAAASVLLPLLISRLRFITLDIFLIIWWAFLELYTANIMYGSHLMEKRTAKRSAVRTLVYTGISLFLYIIYYLPPAYVRFVLGAVPIMLYSVDMIWMTLQMKRQHGNEV